MKMNSFWFCHYCKLKKSYGVLGFNQSRWLKPYFRFNIKKEQKQSKMMTKMKNVVEISEQYFVC